MKHMRVIIKVGNYGWKEVHLSKPDDPDTYKVGDPLTWVEVGFELDPNDKIELIYDSNSKD